MRRNAIALLLLTPVACAQVLVAPEQWSRIRRGYESRPADPPLRCEVTPLAPQFNLAFRFQAGYTFHIPDSQYAGPTSGWSALITITPAGGDQRPVVLLDHKALSEATRLDSNFDVRGVYFLGVGRYSVESLIRDDRNRICRKQWQVVVEPSRGDRAIPSALPPNTVKEFSPVIWPNQHHLDSAAPVRLTILLNAAAFSPRRTVIRPSDRAVLLDALTALLEHLPTTAVRLVAFSLEQQREIYRSNSFAPPDVDKVADAIKALEQTTVDVHLLEKPLGHVDFLAGLIGRELSAPDQPDTVIFLGPTSRYGVTIPKDSLPTRADGQPSFFYLQYQGPRRTVVPDSMQQIPADLPPMGRAEDSTLPADAPSPPRGTGGTGGAGVGGSGSGSGGRGVRGGRGGLPGMSPPMEGGPDIITAAVARLKGKTLAIHTPADLARAIRRIEGLTN
jgi:hypothetical protein